ncbi:hypothetical protein CEXT_759001 [Caerostris extrusa]|uniref:Uncharacterized protein n=1 Tax=Caerostris extrusa TaxID=172846 RepID=A0AAV4NKM1_CAEEX|nr:hypothetical protein CEXT_759001 [Caerostris extrusa]
MSENDEVPDFRAKLYVNNQEINSGSNCISKGIQYYDVFENEMSDIGSNKKHKNQTVEMKKELRTNDNESRDGLLTNKEKSISNSIKNVAINHILGPENYFQDEIKAEYFDNYLRIQRTL